MKKIISLALIALSLSGCSYMRVHKMDIEQGNIVTQENVSRLHKGMSKDQVKAIMGTPMLINVFTPNLVSYVYTFQAGYMPFKKSRITLLFERGKLHEIIRN